MLTDEQLLAAKPTDKPYKLWDAEGLYTQVAPGGAVSWRFRFVRQGKREILILGRWPKVSIARARQLRTELKQALVEGIDPREYLERIQGGPTGRTFEMEFRDWHDAQTPGWSASYAEQVKRYIERDVLPFKVRKGRRAFGAMRPADIEAPDVLEIARAIEERGAFDVTSDVCRWISNVFSHAIVTGHAKSNPATDVKKALVKGSKTHFASIPAEDLPQFYRRLLGAACEKQTRLGIRLMARICSRTSELVEAEWSEVNRERGLIIISPQRMKDEHANRKAHGPYLIPLAPSTLALLDELHRLTGHSRYLFPGHNKPLETISESTWLTAVKRMGYRNKHTVHGFRATFSTYFNSLDTKKYETIVDRQLDHVPRKKVSAAYNRAQYLPERVTLMNDWAAYIDRAESEGGFSDLPMHEQYAQAHVTGTVLAAIERMERERMTHV